MATYNVELRQRISGTFGDTIYLKANWNNLDNKPSTFTPTAHTHGNISNDGKIGSTAGLIIKTGTSGLLEALAAGSSGQFLGHDGTWKDLPAISSAATLTTPRAINGTNFDGSAAITTAKWGTARNIKIGQATQSVDGSANVTWTLPQMGINVVTTCPTINGVPGHVNIYIGSACATKYANWLYFETPPTLQWVELMTFTSYSMTYGHYNDVKSAYDSGSIIYARTSLGEQAMNNYSGDFVYMGWVELYSNNTFDISVSVSGNASIGHYVLT